MHGGEQRREGKVRRRLVATRCKSLHSSLGCEPWILKISSWMKDKPTSDLGYSHKQHVTAKWDVWSQWEVTARWTRQYPAVTMDFPLAIWNLFIAQAEAINLDIWQLSKRMQLCFRIWIRTWHISSDKTVRQEYRASDFALEEHAGW